MRYRKELTILAAAIAVIVAIGLFVEYGPAGDEISEEQEYHEQGGDAPEQPTLDDLN